MHLIMPMSLPPPSPWSLLDCYFKILHLNKSFSVDTRCFQKACNFLPLKVFFKVFANNVIIYILNMFIGYYALVNQCVEN